MKQLVPVAKPIRIRLRLHDTDCTSVEEVKRHFSYEELRPLFEDGRLKRWLEQIGMREKAKRAEAMLNDTHFREREGLLLLSLFFEHEYSIVSQLEVENKKWTEADFKKSEVFDRFIDETSIFNMISHYKSLFSTEDWVRKIASFTTSENWESHRANVEEQFDNEYLSLFIDCCANKGIEAAKQEKEKKQEAEPDNFNSGSQTSGDQSRKTLRKTIDEELIEEFLDDPSNFYMYKIKDPSSTVAKFLGKLAGLYRNSNNIYDRPDPVADYVGIEKSDFDNERIFLKAKILLYKKKNKGGVSNLERIKDSYEPAEYIYRWIKRDFASGLGTEHEHIEKYTSLKQDIKFVVKHLYDYNPSI